MKEVNGQVTAKELIDIVKQRRVQVRGAVLAPVEDTTYLSLSKTEVIEWLKDCDDACRFNVFMIGTTIYIG